MGGDSFVSNLRAGSTSPMGHFETNWTRYRCAAIGLVLLHELTFCTLHLSG